MRGFLKIMILSSLKDNKKSGSEIAENIEKITESKPSPGSLYPSLKKLSNEGIIKSEKKGKFNEYSLKQKGFKMLKDFEKGHEDILNAIRKNIGILSMMSKDSEIKEIEKIMNSFSGKYMPLGKHMEKMIQIKKNVFKKKDNPKLSKILDETIKNIKNLS